MGELDYPDYAAFRNGLCALGLHESDSRLPERRQVISISTLFPACGQSFAGHHGVSHDPQKGAKSGALDEFLKDLAHFALT